MPKRETLYLLLSFAFALFSGPVLAQGCTSDEACSLNGVCAENQCVCDPGWRGDECGQLDLQPAARVSGYNITGEGTSTWGARIVHDPVDRQLYHLFAAEFTVGCGLEYWYPFSRIIRAESTHGPTGPYKFAAEVAGTFAHNPQVVYSAAEKLWLLYHIGCPYPQPTYCHAINLTCGFGNTEAGESGISVLSSPDLRTWTNYSGYVLNGDTNGTWDTDTTNPGPFPLESADDHTPTMLMAYRGCEYNCGGTELVSMASADNFTGPFTRSHSQPLSNEANEDPFLWRDKRGNYHMLMHYLGPGGGSTGGPQVGHHAFTKRWDGAWTFNNGTPAYDTTVNYTDGTSIRFMRRERPQLFFSEDGEMTPLYLSNGVQEFNSSASYTVIQPLGSASNGEQVGGFGDGGSGPS